MKMKALILCLLLTGCITAQPVPAHVRMINETVNAAPLDTHKSVTDDWQGLQNFRGGNCYQKARAKCAMLWPEYKCAVVLGRWPNGKGQAMALVNNTWWLDSESNAIGKPQRFTEITRGK